MASKEIDALISDLDSLGANHQSFNLKKYNLSENLANRVITIINAQNISLSDELKSDILNVIELELEAYVG